MDDQLMLDPVGRRRWLLAKALEIAPLGEALALAQAAEDFISGTAAPTGDHASSEEMGAPTFGTGVGPETEATQLKLLNALSVSSYPHWSHSMMSSVTCGWAAARLSRGTQAPMSCSPARILSGRNNGCHPLPYYQHLPPKPPPKISRKRSRCLALPPRELGLNGHGASSLCQSSDGVTVFVPIQTDPDAPRVAHRQNALHG
jgi:hypothetical protein